jgi:GTPase involved in cell partitioning and DNA repair
MLNILKLNMEKPGSKRNKTGANGKDLVLKVPVGLKFMKKIIIL